MVFNSNQYVNGTKSDVMGVATFSNAAPAPSTNAFNWTLGIALPANGLVNGKSFRFNCGRAQQQDASTPQGMTIEVGLFGQPNTYSADILGSGVLIPEYADVPATLPGMVFSGIVTDGGTDYPFTGRISNKVGHGYSRLDGYGFVNAEAATAGVLPTPGVVSRKVHGTVGAFDIPLPVNGPAGIECRNPGPNNGYQLVFTFDRPVATAGNVAIQGTASVATAAPGETNPRIGPMPNQITVDLAAVANQQHLSATLNNVSDTSGNTFAPVTARMDVLIADVNATRDVDSGDVSLVRQQTLQPVTSSNFREDVNASGDIDSGDVTIVRQHTLTSLP
jgi:hypothetical protein